MNGRERSIDAIVFDVLLLGFCLTIVVIALGLSEKSRMVPLLVGIPTVIALAFVLVRDVRGREPAAAAAAPSGELATADVHDLWQAAVHELEADDQIPDTPEARRRQLAFAIWTLSVATLAALTSLLVAVPLGLLVILSASGIGWLRAATITAITSGALYCLFVLFLEVRI
jgi:hypothetical protein